MSGKLIMKRKRADHQHRAQQDLQENANQPEDGKRQRLELPPNVDALPSSPPLLEVEAPSSILMEALQKIMELQSELDSFEQDLDEREANALEDDNEDGLLDDEVAVNLVMPPRRSEAEALGFAMCARETLLFLQSEGISTDSVLYKSLLDKLVGQSDGLLQA